MGRWRDRTVLVTGSAGFLGGWVVAAARERGARVIGLERDNRREPIRQGGHRPDVVVRGDLLDAALLARVVSEHACDTVLHLAAQAIVGVASRNPVATFETNIRGTWNLLEACRLARGGVRRVIVASSDKAYGTVAQMPCREDMPMQGRDPYSASKSCADLIAQCYHDTFGLPVCIARSANFFGGGDLNFSRIVPGTIRSVLQGNRPILRSDGSMVRDYIYVRDVAEAYFTLAEAMDDLGVAGRAYNISIERPLSVLELTSLVLRLMDRPDLTPILLGEATGEIAEQRMCAARLRADTGWRPAFGLEAGLAETIAWYRAHLAAGDHAPPAEMASGQGGEAGSPQRALALELPQVHGHPGA